MYCSAVQHPHAPRRLREKQAPAPEFSHNPQDKLVLAHGTTIVAGLQPGDVPQAGKARLNAPLAPENGRYVYAADDPRFHAANTFAAVARTIEFFEQGTGMPVSWSFQRPYLDVIPDGGEMLNAYYSPEDGNVNFFHSTDPVTEQVVFSGDSGEVVSHEAGHAILDAFRPAYLYSWRADVGGFHESFGDMLALLMTLQDDRALARVVEETAGDMRRPNLAAALGEELGVTINNTLGKNHTGGDYTRDAINTFKWQDPATLPENPSDPNELGSEVHNFSRLWTGAFYDVFTGLVDRNREAGLPPEQAIRQASSEGIRMLGRLLRESPKFNFTYETMAEVFVRSDRDHNHGKNVDLITRVYKERHILPSTFDPADLPTQRMGLGGGDSAVEFKLVPLPAQAGHFAGAQVEIVRDKDVRGIEDDDSQVQDVERLIAQGRVLYTEPHQRISRRELLDPNGVPYLGILRWKDGQPVIERNRLVT